MGQFKLKIHKSNLYRDVIDESVIPFAWRLSIDKWHHSNLKVWLFMQYIQFDYKSLKPVNWWSGASLGVTSYWSFYSSKKFSDLGVYLMFSI